VEVADSLKAYCTAYAHSGRHEIALNIGCRFLALQDFADRDIAPPRNLSWTFLILSQLIWQQVALEYKEAFNLETVKDQNLQMMVNSDIKQLCILAKKNPTHDMIKGIKVISSF
jgi:hypothetical protein